MNTEPTLIESVQIISLLKIGNPPFVLVYRLDESRK